MHSDRDEASTHTLPALSRRSFLRLTGAAAFVATAGVPALAACTRATTGSSSAGGHVTLPTYVAAKVPPADAPGNKAGVVDGYWRYPQNLARSVQGTPGRGGTVSAFVITYDPAPTPRDQNAYWQELDKRLGVQFQPVIVGQADYKTKLSTVIAGGDLPDMMLLYPRDQVANELAFLQAKCQDLTEFLSGDAVKQYPNLANIPTYAWKAAVFGNSIYGLPQDRGPFGSALYIQQNLADQAGIAQPKNIDDFTRLVKALTQPKRGIWGMGAALNSNYNLQFFQQVFGAPNVWSVDSNGKFTKDVESEGTKQAVAYLRELFQAGVFHPDANNMSTPQSKTAFFGSKTAVYQDGFSAFQTSWRAVAKVDPNFKIRVVVPFGRNGGKGRYFLGAGTFGVTALKKADKSRIQELLRIANYLAAPFGTEENAFINNGVRGIDHTVDQNGNPVITDRGKAEMNLEVGYAGHDYVTGPPWVYVDTDYPEMIKTLNQHMNQLLPLGVSDPTIGLYSGTNADKGASLVQLSQDQISSIIAGRSPMSAYDSFVQQWRSGGGDQIRKEFEQAYHAAHR